MQEKENSNRTEFSPEQQRAAQELERAGKETQEKLREQIEQNAERGAERAHDEEPARHEAEQVAAEVAAEQQKQQEKQSAVAEKAEQKPLTKDDINKKYKETMTDMQAKLPKSSRVFSKVIHNPVIEKTSEVVGNTVARPNLIIAGAIGSLASVVIYAIARRYGYELSGFETIGFFILGWTVGAIIEYARVGLLNSKNRP